MGVQRRPENAGPGEPEEKGGGEVSPFNAFRKRLAIFALILVGLTSGFLLWLSHHLVDILAAPNWCSRAVNAVERADTTGGVAACTGLLITQIKALATTLHVSVFTIALCLGVLVVIILAGARLSGRGPGGIEIDVSADPSTKIEVKEKD